MECVTNFEWIAMQTINVLHIHNWPLQEMITLWMDHWQLRAWQPCVYWLNLRHWYHVSLLLCHLVGLRYNRNNNRDVIHNICIRDNREMLHSIHAHGSYSLMGKCINHKQRLSHSIGNVLKIIWPVFIKCFWVQLDKEVLKSVYVSYREWHIDMQMTVYFTFHLHWVTTSAVTDEPQIMWEPGAISHRFHSYGSPCFSMLHCIL